MQVLKYLNVFYSFFWYFVQSLQSMMKVLCKHYKHVYEKNVSIEVYMNMCKYRKSMMSII